MSKPTKQQDDQDNSADSRLEQICRCMETLDEVRHLKKEDDYPFGRELAEVDTLEELHRLLYLELSGPSKDSLIPKSEEEV